MRARKLLAALFLVVVAVFAVGGPAYAQDEPGEGTEEEHGGLSHDTVECIEQAEEADDPEACQEAPSPILPEPNEIIWGAISFTVLFFLLRKFAWPGIKTAMEGRTERIRTDLEQAEQAKADANQVLDEYRAQLADAKNEAARIIEESRQQADALRRDQEQRLQAELAEMRTRAAADVESAKNQAIADLRGEVAQLAIGAAEVVVQKNLDRDTQTQLIDQYISQVADRSN